MRTLLHRFAKGHLGQYEDEWYLVQNEGEDPYVEHEWDHVRVNGGGASQGTKRLSVDDVLRDGPHRAADRVRELLNLPGS